MYKNKLQELAQHSCFNLPSYTCIREGPDHAPRFKATVNFNGETYESTGFFTTLRHAEHSAAEVALSALSTQGPSHSLTARILDETGVYKNLLQEIAQRVGAPLPSYTTTRSGLGHPPVFTGTVELAGIVFTGEPAKNKKQAEKNAAMAAWTSLKQLAQREASSSSAAENNDEQEQVTLARALLSYRRKEKMAAMADDSDAAPFPKLFFPFGFSDRRPPTRPPPSGSKILPFLQQRSKIPVSPATENASGLLLPKFPAAGAAPYVPIRQCGPFMVPPVTVRTAVPVFSAPHLPPAAGKTATSYHQHQPQPQPQPRWGGHPPPVKCASGPAPPPAVRLRQSVPLSAVPPPVTFVPVQVKEVPKAAAPAFVVSPPVRSEVPPPPPKLSLAPVLPAQLPAMSPGAVEVPPPPPKLSLAPVLPAQPPAMSPAAVEVPPPPIQASAQKTTVEEEQQRTATKEIGSPVGDAAEDPTADAASAVAAAAAVESLKQLEL